MLHLIIPTDAPNCARHIPYQLFVHGEVPNCTTGISSFKLMYGYEARGPLAVLKSSWDTVTSQFKQFDSWLSASWYCFFDCAGQQKYYAYYLSGHKGMKEFKIGDFVYLFILDSNNKLYARWTVPGEVIQRVNPHFYKFKLPDEKCAICWHIQNKEILCSSTNCWSNFLRTSLSLDILIQH